MIRHHHRLTRPILDTPSRVVHRFAVALLVSTLALAHPALAEEDLTKGRLGGTLASFVERYGEPTAVVDQSGTFFDYPDAAYLVVQLYSPTHIGPDEPISLLTVAADRDEAVPATEFDRGDWPIEEARSIAADVAPADAVFGPVDDSVAGSLSMTCSSPALERAFGIVGGRQCRVALQLSSDATVSFVTLTLTSGAELGTEDATPLLEDCAGVVGWANSAARRLETAQSLLDALTTLDEDPAVAVPDLEELATRLDALADEQRAAATPTEVATANFYIIGALTDFAAAIQLAADGIDRRDQATVDEAIDELGEADERAARASEEIEAAVIACDLPTGTPEAR